MKFRTALLAAAAALALPGVASAQVVNGFYVGGGVGFNYLQDMDINPNIPNTGKYTVQPGGGFVGLGSVGYGFGNGLRAEIEGNYRINSNDGKFQQYGVMANLLYDIDLGWGVVPYVGAGAGYAWANADSASGILPSGNTAKVDDTKGGFAFQGIIGAAFPLDNVTPGLSLTAEYRFFGITGTGDYEVKAGNGMRGTTSMDSFYNSSVMLGVRYAFGVTPPPAPAPVAAAPAPARTYLVFFDFDRYNLTDRARGVVAEAANAAKTTGSARIEVSGHTDTVGSAQYNQALSMRRAESVAKELEARGIPRSQMTLQAFGFSRPLVPTGPNVREPQNRRVEIVLK